MKLFLAMTGLAICALASSFLFREFNFGSSELKFIADFGFGGMTVFGSALAIIVTAQLFLGEIEHRTWRRCWPSPSIDRSSCWENSWAYGLQ